jgi:uncharacterized protein (DUF488 family)
LGRRPPAPWRLRPPPAQEAAQELSRGIVRLKRLFTIGYEGKTVAEFLDQLQAAGVVLLIDVRAVAASRRPGFSKTALRGGLAERGIDYLHLRPLGTPAKGREAARAGRTAEMRAIYADQLETPEALLAMEQVLEAAAERPSALLCYEKDAPGCHRAMLAERMVERTAFEVVDL